MGALFTAKQFVFQGRDFVKVMICGLFLTVVQCVLAARLGWAGFGPEWVLVLAVYVALRADLWLAVISAFILGFLRDLVGGGIWGMSSLVLVLTVWLFFPFRSRLNYFSSLTLVPLIFILSLSGCLFVMTPVTAALGWPGENFNPLPSFFMSSITTALIAPLTFSFLEWITTNKKDNRSDE